MYHLHDELRNKIKLEYTRIGDYEIPNLTLKNQNTTTINKYGRLRLNYLKENNKALYTTLLMTNELQNRLVSVSNEAENRLNILMENYQKQINYYLKKNNELNQLEWVKLMNNYKNSAEEIILKELVYTEKCVRTL